MVRSAKARWQAALLLVPALLLALVAATSPADVHWELTFAGDVERWAAAWDAGTRTALWVDLAFAVSVAALASEVVRRWSRQWTLERRRLGAWRHAPWVVLVAGILDVTENLLSLAGRGAAPPSWLPLTVAAIGWWKLTAYALALVGVCGVVVGPVLAPLVRPTLRRAFSLLDTGSHPPTAPPAAPERERGEALGIALSGGGIRAASVALGALRALDVPTIPGRPSAFRRARWLCAVSGGAYTAGGWRITRRPGAKVEPTPTAERDGLFEDGQAWAESVRQRRRYLDNGLGSLLGGIVGALARSGVVLGAVAATAYIVGWLTGSLVGSYAVHPSFSTETELVVGRLVWPWLPPLVVGAVLWLASGAVRSTARAGLQQVGWRLTAASALMATLLVGVPAGIQGGRQAWAGLAAALTETDQADTGAGLVGAVTALAVVSALGGLASARAARRWLRLGGLALGLGWFVLAGKVTDSFARADDAWPRRWSLGLVLFDQRVPTLLIVALGWLVLADAIAAHRLTLGGIYRKRLAGTFALDTPSDGEPSVPLPALDYSGEPTWSAYADAEGPELILVATAHSSRREAGGVKGVAFTFRPRAITLHRIPGADCAVASWVYPTGSWWDGFPRGWLVSRSMALSGAAFASAMGRQALGTTNALLAATNLRLGAWVPNPARVDWFADPATSPRVHLGYLLKEILGRYDLGSDAFVYVTDGGHRDNLGLVELLRERPRRVVVIDASGDRPGSFTTLRQAIELAVLELGVTITVDWAPIERPADGGLPADCVTEGVICYAEASPPPAAAGDDPATARLLYGRAQLCRASPLDLLRYAAHRPRFPSFPTSDQFLSLEEFDHLVRLGEHLGTRLRERLELT